MHGEDARFLIIQSCVPETSLRARGRPTLVRIETPHVRNIPACAGKAIEAEGCEPLSSKHPRVRGEGALVLLKKRPAPETSPRARGRRRHERERIPARRNIPACAGKAALNQGGRERLEKHPRARGEGALAQASSSRSRETSPRARGRLVPRSVPRSFRGNIPACAGKARRCSYWPCWG